LFGAVGYGLDSLGTEETVKQVSVATLKSFHQRLAVPNNCVLAIYGDITPAQAKAGVEKFFGAWPAGAEVKPAVHIERGTTANRVTETRDKKQAVLVLGYPGTTMDSDDRYALDLIQECCSDLGSRLFLRIREQLGLAYYVGAQNFAGLIPGYFAFYTGTEPGKAEQVEKELLKEAELLRTEGLTPEELQRAKAKIIGQKKIARADLGSLASTSALDELYGLGYQRSDLDNAKYEAVTLEQTRAAAQKYLQPAALVVAVVKPE